MRLLNWRHALSERWSIGGNLAEIALPLASGALLGGLVAKAFTMEGRGTIIAADELAALFAHDAHVNVSLRTTFVDMLDKLTSGLVVLGNRRASCFVCFLGLFLKNLCEGHTMTWWEH